MPLQLVVCWPPTVLNLHRLLVNHCHELLLLEGTTQQNVESALLLQPRVCSLDSLSPYSITLCIRLLKSYDETITFIGLILKDPSCLQWGGNCISCRWGVLTRLANVFWLVHKQVVHWMRWLLECSAGEKLEAALRNCWHPANEFKYELWFSRKRREKSKGKAERKSVGNLGFMTGAKQKYEEVRIYNGFNKWEMGISCVRWKRKRI